MSIAVATRSDELTLGSLPVSIDHLATWITLFNSLHFLYIEIPVPFPASLACSVHAEWYMPKNGQNTMPVAVTNSQQTLSSHQFVWLLL
jgi:hypothetical protein